MAGDIVHIDASLIRANVSWDSLARQHVDAVQTANAEDAEAAKRSRKTGKFKKVCTTDPDATMATNGRNRRLEPAYKQHAAVDDKRGVVLDVEVTTGELNEGQHIVEQVDRTAGRTGVRIATVTADAGYAYGKVYGALEDRGISAVIPAKVDPSRTARPIESDPKRPRQHAHPSLPHGGSHQPEAARCCAFVAQKPSLSLSSRRPKRRL